MVTKGASQTNSERQVNLSSIDISPAFAPRMSDKDRQLLPAQAWVHSAIDARTSETVYAMKTERQFYVDFKVMKSGSRISGGAGDYLIQYGEGESRKFRIAPEHSFDSEYTLLQKYLI
jgi:hypothetical protein